ncbi:hypothetical protein TOPH_01533 [Tolypocladium ophioglossoides CBS 100239]|uniref:Uncharacterized protein n=1 Tax=Tolypocladium ophioglossoides (strain CBS 100239) TaxID=1163406 RepID=A0A0L0NHM0_TOLOC|nr:hypothetical protein TOPH_01533 [Tolypocladium ophioglossoides CBS 100239]
MTESILSISHLSIVEKATEDPYLVYPKRLQPLGLRRCLIRVQTQHPCDERYLGAQVVANGASSDHFQQLQCLFEEPQGL